MLLLSEYLAGGKLSYSDALSAISSDIASFKKNLSSKGTLSFGELGTFSMNVKGELAFVPSPNGIDDPYNFGFEPLVLPLLSDLEKKDIVISRKRISRYITAAASIAVVIFLIAPFVNSMLSPSMKASISDMIPSAKVATPASPLVVESQEQLCEIRPVQATITETIPELKTEITTEETDNITVVEVADNIIEESEKYYIIVASSPNAKNAELAISELSAKMEAEYTVVEGNGRHRIAYGCYSNESEATDALSAIKSIFPDAWILTH